MEAIKMTWARVMSMTGISPTWEEMGRISMPIYWAISCALTSTAATPTAYRPTTPLWARGPKEKYMLLASATPSASSGPWPWQELTLSGFQPDLGMYLKGFGQDQSGELYLTTSGQQGVSGTTGKVYQLVAQ